jgi:hypothetical protein
MTQGAHMALAESEKAQKNSQKPADNDFTYYMY